MTTPGRLRIPVGRNEAGHVFLGFQQRRRLGFVVKLSESGHIGLPLCCVGLPRSNASGECHADFVTTGDCAVRSFPALAGLWLGTASSRRALTSCSAAISPMTLPGCRAVEPRQDLPALGGARRVERATSATLSVVAGSINARKFCRAVGCGPMWEE
jgi:hypothetical protein